ncbi:hypothetical protein SLA2020_031860 [Shorea laevis]
MLFFSVLKRKTALNLIIVFLVLVFMSCCNVQGKCRTGCDLALASYYVSEDASNLTYISTIFSIKISEILTYNPQIEDSDYIATEIKVPFSCDCLNADFLGHTFTYITQFGDTYDKVAQTVYANLTTEDWVHRFNIYDDNRIPINSPINVTVNCSCGDRRVSRDYGLFTTYPLRQRENLSTVAAEAGVSTEILIRYNPGANISAESGLVFVPTKDQNGTFPPLKIRAAGIRRGVIAGISEAVVAGTLLFLVCLYVRLYKKKRVVQALFLKEASHQEHYIHNLGSGSTPKKDSETAAHFVSPGLLGITVNKSVEFSYDELANATDNFSMANKIGQGCFGSVYYAEIRGEKAAIKKMEKEASKEFLAELKVLTNVHHLNLVRLIGYCIEGSLFVVYEFVENGNLSHHLRGSGGEPIPWPTRVQIALDSAQGLEYIHEYTDPVYMHRDIKSANILLDKNFHAKVADFGLTKLFEYGNSSLHMPTRLVGTFGYMPPEYAHYGDVFPMVDVYAFGVVLYELISAKEAIVKISEDAKKTIGLVALFEHVLSQPNPNEDLRKLVDPKLGDNYSMDEIFKMAHLAKACVQENPQHRPSMRSIVVALATLSSSNEDWDIQSYYGNKALVNQKKRVVESLFLKEASHQERYIHSAGSTLKKNSETVAHVASPGLPSITVDKSVEFSYDELANATDNFNVANKIGEGGFGSVYYAEIRGEKAAIKKMEKKASKQFLAELKVLTNVHHLNLVRLIGYCIKGSLFLVYEFMENGDLSHHLRGSGRDPIPWPTRVQIALDSALGLEYIHEHTFPVYVHRDIKSANILLDKNFCAKVGDFGLTKLSEHGNFSLQLHIVGTHGYMPPECGNVSPKVDVYAFGVVLYELISAKNAVIKSGEDATETTALAALFKHVLNQPDSKEGLRKLVDPKLGDNYPMDEVFKIAQLAKACTEENPQHRPSMRSVVFELTTLLSSTED